MIVYVSTLTEITVETKLTEKTRYPGGQRLEMTTMLNMCMQRNTAAVVCATVNVHSSMGSCM